MTLRQAKQLLPAQWDLSCNRSRSCPRPPPDPASQARTLGNSVDVAGFEAVVWDVLQPALQSHNGFKTWEQNSGSLVSLLAHDYKQPNVSAGDGPSR